MTGDQVLQFFQQVPQFYCKTCLGASEAALGTFALLGAGPRAIVVLVVLPLGWKPIIVDTDVNAYRRADGPASRAQLSYLSSLSFMRAVRNESSLSQRRTLKIEVLYEAKQGSVFGEAVLRDIRTFEQSLKSLAGWTKLCDAAEPALQFQCSPGESFGNYVWPQRGAPS
ncbi:unnamed protein product [Effrenium voratum]|nr:unnamed protein product [Effrenium voratum]